MRTILLMASEYAKINEFIFEFSEEHIQAILERIIIKNPKDRVIIYAVFNYTHTKPNILTTSDYSSFTHSQIESDSSACAQSVLEKLSVLKKMGIDIDSDIGYEIYNGELPKNYKHFKKDDNLDDISIFPFQNINEEERVSEEDFDKIIESPKGFQRLHRIKELKNTLNETVLNQEHAVEAVCDALIKSEHIQDSERPKGIFFFLGPPATGKTFLAETIRENLRDYNSGMVFDMTQFTHEDGGGTLYGTSKMWGNTKPGSLTSYVRKHPKSIIVFDEFEKAHTSVQSNLLSILSGGYLTDVCGWCGDGEPWTSDRKDDSSNKCDEEQLISKVDFSQTIVIFTSNLGKEVYNNQSLMANIDKNSSELEQMMFDAISREEKIQKADTVSAITPEMLSRLRQGSMVLFNKLEYKELRVIAKQTFNEERIAFEKNYNVKISYDDSLLDILLLSFSPSFDIRAMKSAIGKRVFDSITDHYMNTSTKFSSIKIYVDESIETLLQELSSDQNAMMKNLKRKNLAIEFETSYSNTKTILKITMSNVSTSIIKKAKDFTKDGISVEVPDVSFSDIAGHDFAKEKLKEIVSLLKDFKTLQSLETKLSKGMLLYGPPGTGKTMLAKALANEADLPFISTTGDDLLKKGRVDKIFSTAREYAPSIIFIDEIDAIPSRGKDAYADTVVTQLLTKMDGFNSALEEPIFVIAATNRFEHIDSAILRSGRIDIHIKIANLDKDARKYFISKMLNKPMFAKDIDIQEIIKFTASLSGSDLEKVERESILFMYRNKLNKVTHEILLEQVNTIKYGRKIEDKNLQNALEETAYHEAGHAVLSKVLNPFKKIEQVTVMPRNDALGFVSYAEDDEYHNHNIEYIKNNICVSLGGRTAQMNKFGTQGMDSGASSDLDRANHLAYVAIARYGMDDELKNLSVKILDDKESMYKNEIIFKRMNAWMEELTQRTEELVNEHWASIDIVAKQLIENEYVDEKALDEAIKSQDNNRK